MPLHDYTAPLTSPSHLITPLSISIINPIKDDDDVPMKRSHSHNHLVETRQFPSLSITTSFASKCAEPETKRRVSLTKRKGIELAHASHARRRSSLMDTATSFRRYAPLHPPPSQHFRIDRIIPKIVLPQAYAHSTSNQEQGPEPEQQEAEEENKPSPPKRKRTSMNNQHFDARAVEAAMRVTEAGPRRMGPYFRFASLLMNQHPGPTELFEETSNSFLSPTNMAPSLLSERQKQVECICREIIQTEESYVESLRSLLVYFFEPLAVFASEHSLPLNAMAALHTSTTTILSIHEELLRQLQPLKALNEPQQQCDVLPSDPFGFAITHGSLWWIHQLTQAFCTTIEYMKVEAFYCASYRCAKMELEQLQRKHPCLHTFTLELYDRARAPPRNVDIISNLIKPVQRICVYPLLFRELLKQSPGREGTLMIQQSLAKIEAVVNHVNEKVRQVENNARLYELHASLNTSSAAKLELLQPSRVLLYETTATMINLDTPRWPSKILRVLRRRLRRSSMEESSRMGSIHEPMDVNNDRRLSYIFNEPDSPRRGSSTISARFGSLGSVDSVRSSFSTVLSPTNANSRSGQFRRTQSGERVRLILLSDMLLMAKRKEQHLKIRRQICLSCAIVHDMEPVPVPTASDKSNSVDATLAPSVDTGCLPATTTYSTTLVLEVSKIGRCHCHHLSPATLRRTPWVNPLSSLLHSASSSIIRRTSSMSFHTNASQLFTTLQSDSAPAVITTSQYEENGMDTTEDVDEEEENEVIEEDLFASRSCPSASRSQSQSRVGRPPDRMGSNSPFAPFRSIKRYLITCETPKHKTEFVHALQQAIARAARGSPSNFQMDKETQDNILWSHPSSSLHQLGDRAKAVAKVAVQFPTKLWHSLNRTTAPSSSPSHRLSTNRNRMVSSTPRHRRRRRSLAQNSSAVYRNSVHSEVDLLEFDVQVSTQGDSNSIDCTTA